MYKTQPHLMGTTVIYAVVCYVSSILSSCKLKGSFVNLSLKRRVIFVSTNIARSWS